jgi:hypothetical protein
VISAVESEVLIDGKLAEDLGVIAPDYEKWKFINDSCDQTRREAIMWCIASQFHN